MLNSQIKIFLIEPINHNKYKAKIVYADSEADARIAASTAHNLVKIIISQKEKAETDPVYLNQNLSICIEVEVTIQGINGNVVNLIYKEKIYHLFKNEAEDVF